MLNFVLCIGVETCFMVTWVTDSKYGIKNFFLSGQVFLFFFFCNGLKYFCFSFV